MVLITIVTGAFVNQQTSLGGLALSHHLSVYFWVTFRVESTWSLHDAKENCRFPKAPIAVPKFKFSKLLVPKVWQCRPGKIKLKLQNKFSKNWKVKRWRCSGDLSQWTNLLVSVRIFWNRKWSDSIGKDQLQILAPFYVRSGSLPFPGQPRLDTNYSTFFLCWTKCPVSWLYIHQLKKKRVWFVNYKYQLI